MPAWGWFMLGALAPHMPLFRNLPLVAGLSWGVSLALLLSRRWRPVGWLLLGLGWTLFAVAQRQELRIHTAGVERAVPGQVEGLPRVDDHALEFRFRVEAPAPEPLTTGALLRVRWFAPYPELHPGQRWQLPLRLKPPRGRVNFHGPDIERWWFNEGFAALGTVRGAGARRLPDDRWTPDRWRGSVRAALAGRLVGHDGLGLVLALAIADRDALGPELHEALRVTGTGHLLAISGMHVGLVSMFAYALGLALAMPLMVLLRRIPLQHLAAWLAMLAASAYGMLAGFGTSTQRALIMLAVLFASRWLRFEASPWQGLGIAGFIVLMLDPMAPSRAGTWLSFGAVAVLLGVFLPRVERESVPVVLLRAQFAISIGLLPLTLLWFGQAGIGGLPANLIAIPWVSFITLPLVLLSLPLLMLDQGVAEIPLFMAADAAQWIAGTLRAIADRLAFAPYLHAPSVSWSTAVIAAAGAAMLSLPGAMRERWLGLLLLLPLFLRPAAPPDAGDVRLELLDVGQGLAALVETRDHLLLYDSGPGAPGEWDLVSSVLLPAVASRGRAPDRVIISHGDLDHAGGADTLRVLWPDAHFLGQLPPQRGVLTSCDDRRYWAWDEVRFDVLHPSPWLPYLGNDSSCVLAVRAAGGSILLPGDIGRTVERRLAAGPADAFELLVLPHHGSRSSTSPELLDWARPRHALVPAGADNRFGFPHREVIERLRQRQLPVSTTGACGSLRLDLVGEGEIVANSARRQRPGWWRWPPDPACP